MIPAFTIFYITNVSVLLTLFLLYLFLSLSLSIYMYLSLSPSKILLIQGGESIRTTTNHRRRFYAANSRRQPTPPCDTGPCIGPRQVIAFAPEIFAIAHQTPLIVR